MTWWDRLLGRETETREQRGPIERRAVKAATQHVQWATPGQPLIPEWDALTAIHRAYYGNILVYRCVQVRAQQVANPKIPLRVGADPDRAEDYDPNSPLLRLFRANQAVSWRQLIAQSSAQYDVTGRFAWELDLDGRNQPRRAYPLISAYVYPVPTTRAGAEDYWQEFWYKVTAREGPYRKLRPEQVVYAWRPSLHDWRQPESLLQAARLNISVASMIDRYNHAFLLNDARPASVVVTQAFEETGEYERFKAEWEGRFGGPDNAGKAAFLEAQSDDGPADTSKWIHVESLGLSQRDAQVMETYQQELRAVTIAFGVPLSILGDSSERTFSNASEEHQNFWQTTMLPHFADLADHITRSFAGLLGSNVVWFDTSAVPALREPSKFQVPVLADLIGSVVTVNEARSEVGLPPTGDPQHDRLDKPAPEPVAEPAPPGDDQDENEAEDEPAPSATRVAPETTAMRFLGLPETPPDTPEPPEDRARDPEADRERRAREWRAVDAQVRILERTWTRQIRNLFQQQEKATLDRLTGKRGRQALRDPDAEQRALGIFDVPWWIQRTADLVRTLYEGAFAIGVTRVAGRFPDIAEEAWDVEQPFIRQYIVSRANQLSGRVTDTTYRQIQQAMVDGAAAGEGTDEIATRIRAVFRQASQNRAEMIARTEVLSAANASAVLVAEQLPRDLAAGLEWVATPDHRTREDHREMDGAVVAMGGMFQVGDPSTPMPYPGWPSAPPEQVIRCRCTTIVLSPEELADRQQRAYPQMVEVRTAAHAVALVIDGVIAPEHVTRILEVAA